MAIKLGPYRGREYARMTWDELRENLRWSGAMLDKIHSNQPCTWSKFAHLNYSWGQIASYDPGYYEWAISELDWQFTNSREELRKREPDRERPAGPPPGAIDAPPLFTDDERGEIIRGNYLADWREWVHKGWRIATANGIHPDSGGSHEAFLRHGKSRELLERLLADFEKALEEE